MQFAAKFLNYPIFKRIYFFSSDNLRINKEITASKDSQALISQNISRF